MKDNKLDLESFRRELEEDIANFNQEDKVNTASTAKASNTHLSTSSPSHHHSSVSAHHSSSHTRSSSKNHSRSKANKRKKRNKGFKVVCVVLAIILLIAAGGYGFLHWELNRISRNSQNDVTQEEVKNHLDSEDKYGVGSSSTDVVSNPDITNILLIGQDRKEGQKAEMRSDAMIICSINAKTKEITLCSLMRDMYVPVPGYGYGMLNHTYMIGGFDLLNKTIEKDLGIPIDGNVEVDFNRFMELIDILGGVNVDITEEEANYLNARMSGWNLSPGKNLLNSEQALYYCRIRKNIGGDWGRTDRQRKVIMSAFNQLKTAGAGTMLNFAHEALPLLTTNLTNNRIIKYAYALASYKMSNNYSYRIPVEGTYTQEVREEVLHVLIPDLAKNAEAIKGYLYKKG